MTDNESSGSVDQQETELRRCVCPIWSRSGKAPEAVGSSTLLQIGQQGFALTATHVINYFDGRGIHIGTSKGFRPIVGQVSVSVTPDTTDTAFISLHPEITAWLAEEYGFLVIDQIDLWDLPTPTTGYQFFGVPYRKVHRPRNERRFHFPVYSYAAPPVPPSTYESLGLLQVSHVAVDFVERRVRDGTGRIITAPNPEGMSGGPVFSLQRPTSIGPATTGPNERRFVALAIEHRKGVLIGIRVAVALDAIRRAYPHLGNLIPALPPWLKILH